MLTTPEGDSEETNLFGITGSHGTGKTTLMREFLVAALRGRAGLPAGVKVYGVAEQATAKRLQLGDPDLFTRHNSYQLQHDIMALQIFAPLTALSQAHRERRLGHSVILTDRTVVDPVSYAKLSFPDNWQEARVAGVLESFIPDMARLYRGVAVLPTGAIPLVSDNGLRSPDQDFQQRADEQLRADYAAVGVPLYELPSDPDINTRVASLGSFISECLAVEADPHPLYGWVAPAPRL